MLARFLRCVAHAGRVALHAVHGRLLAATKPAAPTLVAGALADLVRSKPELAAENALLRQQLVVLQRGVKRPRCTDADRALLVLLAGRVRAWRSALLLVQPDTLLRWHRQLFRRSWRRKSWPISSSRRPKVPPETIALIRQMAANPLWGAEYIRGELLKLDIRVAKWIVQQYLRSTRAPRPRGQPWATFLRNHADDIWGCDFLPVTDLLFRPMYAFFVVALGSRRVVHLGVTCHPTDAWIAQQRREATPFDRRPRYLIRDNDRKYGHACNKVAEGTGIEVRRTTYRAPREHAACKRFLGSVRRKCLDLCWPKTPSVGPRAPMTARDPRSRTASAIGIGGRGSRADGLLGQHSPMRVAAYVRVSTTRQVQQQTIEQQLDRLVAHARGQGWALPAEHLFRDDGYSGGALARPGLDRLRDKVQNHELDRVLITAPDRLARNYVQQMVLLEEFARAGCQVDFLDRPMSDDPHDQLLLQIRGAVAEYEWTLIAERMRRGRLSKLQAGLLLPWTRPPYGYRLHPERPRDPSGVTVAPAEAAIVAELFALYLEPAMSLAQLAKTLQRRGVPTPTGNRRWSCPTIRGILRNPTYTGQVYAQRTHYRPPQIRRSATHPLGRPHGTAAPVLAEKASAGLRAWNEIT